MARFEARTMVRNCPTLERFELEQIRSTRPDFKRNLAIVEALYQEALNLGVLPRKDPLEGIEIIIRVARVVNSV